MKLLRQLIGLASICWGLTLGNVAYAGIPVIDATSITQQIKQVVAWAQQAQQMVQQLEQKQQYDSLNGVRGMASLLTIRPQDNICLLTIKQSSIVA